MEAVIRHRVGVYVAAQDESLIALTGAVARNVRIFHVKTGSPHPVNNKFRGRAFTPNPEGFILSHRGISS